MSLDLKSLTKQNLWTAMIPPQGQVDLQLHQLLVADPAALPPEVLGRPGSKKASFEVWIAARASLNADCSAAAGVGAGSQVEVPPSQAEKQVNVL